ncbi:MAG: hypothetical protein V4702_05565 [Patescibacteria group bacterium]
MAGEANHQIFSVDTGVLPPALESEAVTITQPTHEAGFMGVVRGVGHVIGAAALEAVSILNLQPFSPRAQAAVANASPARRSLEARMTTADAMRGQHPSWIGK